MADPSRWVILLLLVASWASYLALSTLLWKKIKSAGIYVAYQLVMLSASLLASHCVRRDIAVGLSLGSAILATAGLAKGGSWAKASALVSPSILYAAMSIYVAWCAGAWEAGAGP